MNDFFELNAQQKRQLIDSEMLFHALEQAEAEGIRHRGSMFWREQDGGRYLIALSAHSRQRSLGTFSSVTESIHERFMTRKVEVEARLKSLKKKRDECQRMNKALRIGRTPDILIDLLNAMMRYGVAEHFLVVGTHALFAYESAAGVRFPNDVMTTQDADLLFDTGKRAAFLEVMGERKMSFLGILKKVDKTFERDLLDASIARNAAGYEVDLIRRFPLDPEDTSEHPLQLTPEEGDLWPVRASMGQKLLSVPRFDQVVVGIHGGVARMRTVHPLDFARIKRELSNNPNRDPRKKAKDLAQADGVERLVALHLPHLARSRQQG
jgi:Nucleotidyltransferase